MNTADYLTRHGWLGDGHTLHPSGRGIKKPLSVSQKTNTFGLGKNPHDAISNLWWEKAYEKTLKNLNLNSNSNSAGSKNKEERSRNPEDPTTGSEETLQIGLGYSKEKRTASQLLYGHFTKGESLGGTFGSKDAVTRTTHDRHGFEANRLPDTAHSTRVGSKHVSQTSSPLAASKLIRKEINSTLDNGQVSSLSVTEPHEHVYPKLGKEPCGDIQTEQLESAYSNISPDESETAGKSKSLAKKVKLSKQSKKDRKHNLEKLIHKTETARRKRRKAKKAHKKEKSSRNE
ncbi:MAG: hypothetical protein LQ342_000448 [Letrouitia transgressa]|nr:MAG: hypothetical protein LQ342_000448 [Letrouitia transgressa]